MALAVEAGERDVGNLTNMIFFIRHAEMAGRRIGPEQRDLAREWLSIRDRIVRPTMAMVLGPSASALWPADRRSTDELSAAWRGYRCAEHRMVEMRILGSRTPVNPLTREAFTALSDALRSTGYRPTSVWNYNCRNIKGRRTVSLHSYGLAVDIDPCCNPHRVSARRPARFSAAATQEARCCDVVMDRADTAFSKEQVAAVEAIKTVDGLQVFAWGGRWPSAPDSMHFQINVSPEELGRGIAPT